MALTWLFKGDSRLTGTGETWSVSFTSNETAYQKMYWEGLSALGYQTVGGSGYAYVYRYSSSSGYAWTNDAYRLVTFDEEPTGTLLTFLQTNAGEAVTVTNDIEGCTLSPTIAGTGMAYTGTLTADSTHTVPSTVYVNGTAYTVTSNQFTVPASAVTGSFHVTGTSASIKDVQLKDGSDLLLPVTKVRNIQDLTATAAQINKLIPPSTAEEGEVFMTDGDGGTDFKLPFVLDYVTSAPTAANTNGLKIAVLTSEPSTKYSGWLYVITEA